MNIIDDYSQNGGLGELRLLCSFYHESLCSLIVKEIQQLCDLTSDWFQIEGRETQRSHLKLSCEF